MQKIFGIYGLENFSDAEAVETISKTLSPERNVSRGLEFWSDESNLALGAAGDSILESFSGDCLTLSGEIENSLEIATQLKSEGFPIENNVLLSALGSWGLEHTLKKLKGKFCFAWWCSKSEKLTIARDRFGINPIYWCAENEKGCILFASEIKTLLATGFIPRKVNAEAVIDYLRYSTVHAPLTVVDGIQLLEPGCAIEIQDETVNVLRWWETSKEISPSGIQPIDETLLNAVNSKLAGESQAIYLSGAPNSITLTAAMSQVSQNPVNTFSLEFEGSESPTEDAPSRISTHFSTNHTKVFIPQKTITAKLQEAIDQMDHPSLHGLRSYFVATSAKAAGYTSVVSEIGGNELFGEHPLFDDAVQLMKHRWLTAWPRGLRKSAGKLLQTISPGERSNKLAEILASNYFDLEHTYPLARQITFDRQIKKLAPNLPLTRNKVFYTATDLLRVGKAAFSLPFLSKASVLEMNTHMVDTLLRDNHTFHSGNGTDYTTPFLDHSLVSQMLGCRDSRKPSLEEVTQKIASKNVQSKTDSASKFPWELKLEGSYLEFHEEGMTALSDLKMFHARGVQEFDNNPLHGVEKRLNLSILGHYLKKNNLT
tara:strand:+ start:12530 stop:14323 length:1794 start_codon:yes stop_codon:yes gene_type:complete